MDKVKFWKRDDDPLDLDSELPPFEAGKDHLGLDTNTGIPSSSLSSLDKSNPPEQSFPQRSFQSDPDFSSSRQAQTMPVQSNQNERDMELINSKLDAIKHALESMDQRLKKIEHLAENDKPGAGKFVGKDPWGKY